MAPRKQNQTKILPADFEGFGKSMEGRVLKIQELAAMKVAKATAAAIKELEEREARKPEKPKLEAPSVKRVIRPPMFSRKEKWMS